MAESESASPSVSPSASPSVSPSASESSSESSSVSPSTSPSSSESSSTSPSTSPSESPSVSPSASPSVSPSASESASPSVSPSSSESSSVSPSTSPSASPSVSPSASPSASPSVSPSSSSSSSVSSSPSASPSAAPVTAKKIYDLNRMNAAASRAQLGTLLMGGAVVPDVGSVHMIKTLRYDTTPAVKSATATKTAIALTASAQVGVTAGIVQPDVPRTITVKGNASGITGNMVIHGTDIAGNVLSDTIALSGASEVLGLVAFASVTSIDYPAQTHSGTDTVSIGRGAGIGFPAPLQNTAALITADLDGAADGGTPVANRTIGKSVYIVNGTMNAAKTLSLTFLV